MLLGIDGFFLEFLEGVGLEVDASIFEDPEILSKSLAKGGDRLKKLDERLGIEARHAFLFKALKKLLRQASLELTDSDYALFKQIAKNALISLRQGDFSGAEDWINQLSYFVEAALESRSREIWGSYRDSSRNSELVMLMLLYAAIMPIKLAGKKKKRELKPANRKPDGVFCLEKHFDTLDDASKRYYQSMVDKIAAEAKTKEYEEGGK